MTALAEHPPDSGPPDAPLKRLSEPVAQSKPSAAGAKIQQNGSRTTSDDDRAAINGTEQDSSSNPLTNVASNGLDQIPDNVNPLFHARKQFELAGETEAYLDKNEDGEYVVKAGRPPECSWIPALLKSDTPSSTESPPVGGAADAAGNHVKPSSTTATDSSSAADSGPHLNSAEYSSSTRDSVRMKIFTKLLPDGVDQPDHLGPRPTDSAEHGLDLATILGTRPRSPGHSERSFRRDAYPSPNSAAARPLPAGSADGESVRGASVVTRSEGEAEDEAAKPDPTVPKVDGADPPKAPDTVSVSQIPGDRTSIKSASAANSRHVPVAPRSPRPPDSPRATSPRRKTGPGSGAMQRSQTHGELETASGSSASKTLAQDRPRASSVAAELRPPQSPTRLMPPSPSMGPRARSFDQAWAAGPSSGRRSVEPPARSGSGDEFEDEMARKADVMRKERMSRKADEEKGEEKEREKGKRRVSSALSDGLGYKGDVLVGNLIGEGHANYVLMYNMLTGIRIGVSRCQAKVKRPLTDEDYTARHKFSFDIVGNELTPSAKYDFKFKDYAPWVFRELREYFHLDPADYLLSLTAKYILSELGSPGKSGSFFYFSRDYRFIIKTIHHSEHKFLRKILKQYHEHVKKNPHTLLSRFYGLHRVKLPRGRKIHFVIMNNLFPPHRDVHETYDLKGSSVGREYPEDKALKKPGAVLKDLNWVHRGRVIDVGPEKRALFEEQLRRDTEFLQRLGIMDYSLLIGFHNMMRGNKDNLRDDQLRMFQPDTVKARRPTQIKRDQEHAASALRKAVQRSDPKALSEKNRLPDKDRSERRHFIFYQDEGGFQATDDTDEPLPMIYYLGIIDILTPYNWIKRGEHCWKGLSQDKHQISSVPPIEYGNRFLAFMFSIVRGGSLSTRPAGLMPKAALAEPDVPASEPAKCSPSQPKTKALEGGQEEEEKALDAEKVPAKEGEKAPGAQGQDPEKGDTNATA